MLFVPSIEVRGRIYRQTVALCRKNLLLFSRSPYATAFRALFLPILFTVILCSVNKFTGVADATAKDEVSFAATSKPIKTLWEAMEALPLKKLVLCRNGFSGDEVNSIFNSTVRGLSADRYMVLDNPDELILRCRQSLSGVSDCAASIIITSLNETNVDYIIAVDSTHTLRTANYQKHRDLTIDRLLPLQWAMDSSIRKATPLEQPLELPWSVPQAKPAAIATWFMIIYYFAAPTFLLALIGAVYHLSLFVAHERETGIIELLAAQTCTLTPRLFSTIISFVALYSPGWIICSIVMSQVLFTKCPDIILLFLTLLAGTSLTTWSLFLASFFKKAQVAGLYASIITFFLAFVTVAFVFDAVPQYAFIQTLAALFPPFTYATLIGDIARAEDRSTAFSLHVDRSLLPVVDPNGSARIAPQLDGYLYIVFFIVQIIAYTGATFAVEHYKWGVKALFESLESNGDLAVKCTTLSKTFKASRRWYWPCSRRGRGHAAVKNMDLELKVGSVNFLLGPNGGGKTTTLNCLAGITAPDHGSRIQISENCRNFGVCPQLNVFWEGLTVKEHVQIWGQIKHASSRMDSDIDDVLVECDIVEKANQAVETLSGGQKRKVQLAISFIGDSTLCFIDEATSGLDPLSRRSVWNIISNSHSRRTILITSQFLEEADMLADNIAIIFEGNLITTGSATHLKSTYGGRYAVKQIQPEGGAERPDIEGPAIWRLKSSAEATKKLLELEEFSGGRYSVTFPTLDEAFLHLTNSSLHAESVPGDGADNSGIGRRDTEDELLGVTVDTASLEFGRRVNLFSQILIIIKKRYMLAMRNWLSFSLALVIPIVLAAALSGSVAKWPKLSSCTDNLEIGLQKASAEEAVNFYGSYVVLKALKQPDYFDDLGSAPISAIVGPSATFDGALQNQQYMDKMSQYFSNYSLDSYPDTAAKALGTRRVASTIDEVIAMVKESKGQAGFGVLAPVTGDRVLVHRMSPEYSVAGLNLISNNLLLASANGSTPRTIGTTYRKFRHVEITPDAFAIPFFVFITLGLICSTSISIIYPVAERLNKVRALQYSNSVSPAALWTAYLIFDMHTGIITSVLTWAILFGAGNAKIFYESTFVLLALILFCVATYLGVYICSMFLKRAAFAVAVGVHIALMIVYLVTYVVNESKGPVNEYDITLQIHGGLGFTSPAANLLRAFFIAAHNFKITCGETGWYELHPIAYTLYGGVYMNLIFQILFLSLVIFVLEYGSKDWFSGLLPSRIRAFSKTHKVEETTHHHSVNATDIPLNVITAGTKKNKNSPILEVENITKTFGALTAVENVTFSIDENETLALLGANGAGKSTTFNMIRGLLRPDHGTIKIDSFKVSTDLRKSGLHMGVCPQDDAVDNLTVYQTLNFYAAIKGLRKRKENVDMILKAFQITQFSAVLMAKLSGGTRRKVMVCIALLGNPRLLLLDEPSTGLDAGAQRILWKNIQSFAQDRAILLTTHSMEEVEALATKVAIVKRKLLAEGTITSLKEKHGGTYHIRATYDDGAEEDVKRVVTNAFGGAARGMKCSFGEVRFQVALDTPMGKMMQIMESLVVLNLLTGDGIERKLLKQYTIAEPAMDDVFLNVCEANEEPAAV